MRRLAILPPEVLIDDASSQWLSTALPVVWEEDLSPAPNLIVTVVSNASAAYGIGATDVLRTVVEKRGGRLRLQGAITDTTTQRNRDVFEVWGSDALPVANAFAKHIDSRAVGFSTKNEGAFETFTHAFERANLTARMDTLNGAIGMDPSFGLAYLVLAQTIAQANPKGLSDVLAQADAHAKSFSALDRAKFTSLFSEAQHAKLSDQEKALRGLLELAPQSLDALAGLGSLRFLEGDAKDGQALMTRALEVSPGNANVRQQLARGLLETRRFTDAEKILAGLENSPGILPELATCVLLEGDVRRANAISDRFAQSLQSAGQLIYRANWLAVSGDVAGAIAALEGQRFEDPNLQSAVVAELVIWRVMQRDFAAAKEALSSSGGTPGAFTAQALALSQVDAPLEEWLEKVESSALTAEQKSSVLGYGLFLGGHNAEAVQSWQTTLDRSGGTDLRARAMLASSLERSGNVNAAQKVTVQPFVPEFGDFYAAVSFGEMRSLLKLKVQ